MASSVGGAMTPGKDANAMTTAPALSVVPALGLDRADQPVKGVEAVSGGAPSAWLSEKAGPD